VDTDRLGATVRKIWIIGFRQPKNLVIDSLIRSSIQQTLREQSRSEDSYFLETSFLSDELFERGDMPFSFSRDSISCLSFLFSATRESFSCFNLLTFFCFRLK